MEMNKYCANCGTIEVAPHIKRCDKCGYISTKKTYKIVFSNKHFRFCKLIVASSPEDAKAKWLDRSYSMHSMVKSIEEVI